MKKDRKIPIPMGNYWNNKNICMIQEGNLDRINESTGKFIGRNGKKPCESFKEKRINTNMIFAYCF